MTEALELDDDSDTDTDEITGSTDDGGTAP